MYYYNILKKCLCFNYDMQMKSVKLCYVTKKYGAALELYNDL